MPKKNKKFPVLGTLIGMALWGSLAYVLYPHWSTWIFGGLLVANTLMLGKGVLSR